MLGAPHDVLALVLDFVAFEPANHRVADRHEHNLNQTLIHVPDQGVANELIQGGNPQNR